MLRSPGSVLDLLVMKADTPTNIFEKKSVTPHAFLNLLSSSRFQSGQTLLTLTRRKWRRGSCLIAVSFLVVVFLRYVLPLATTTLE